MINMKRIAKKRVGLDNEKVVQQNMNQKEYL